MVICRFHFGILADDLAQFNARSVFAGEVAVCNGLDNSTLCGELHAGPAIVVAKLVGLVSKRRTKIEHVLYTGPCFGGLRQGNERLTL